MTLDHEALHNRIRQNQAYNDHIVSQQNSIVKQFDKIGSLEERVKCLEAYEDIFENCQSKHKDHLERLDKEVSDLKSKVESLIQVINDMSYSHNILYDTINNYWKTYNCSLEELKNDLQSFKTRWLADLVKLDQNLSDFKEKTTSDIQSQFIELNKQIPETPPYIQDLRDTINHKIRVFEIEVAKAVDKANHAEMLYKAVEKRTRQ
jgi:chromosome segregation ATPase